MNKHHNIVFSVSHHVYSFAPFQGYCGEGETDGYKR